MLLAFFAGVLTTLYFLVPGKSGTTVVVSGDRQNQLHQISQVGEKIEKSCDLALFYTYKARDYVRQELSAGEASRQN